MDTRYDEALERARAGMPIDEVFPELKESEDEKIRKELIEQVAHIVPDSTEFDDNGEVLSDYFKRIEKYRAYLERQKESLHISETCKENADSFTDEKIRKWLIEEIKATHDYDSPTSRKCVDDAIAYLERQKEQNPANAEWSEEDEKMLASFLHKLEVCDDLLTNKEITWAKHRLKSIRPHPSWKPSEYMLSLVKKVADGEMLTNMEQMAMGTLYNDLKKL